MPSAAAIERYFADSREAGWYANGGPCHELLTERIEAYVGGGIHAAPVASGTAGLLVALRAVVPERRSGRNEVVVPSFTFIATANAIRWAGYEPVFADVDLDHWHLSPESLGAVLEARGDRVAAVLAVSTFGTAPPRAVSEAWRRVADAAGVPLVVDSAAGFGARDESGARLGHQGDLEVFSFHATKPFAVGEGGLVTTADAALADRVRRLMNFDFDTERAPRSADGLNAKLDELHCAVGLAVLDSFDDVLAHRAARAGEMRSALSQAGLAFQTNCATSTWQFLPVLAADDAGRGRIMRTCERVGIEARRYYDPLHAMTPFRDAVTGDLSATESLRRRQVSLPMSNVLDAAGAERVTATVLAAVA
jgi:dTDP-4-amino-4,6-dideoxygalactose transaminase